MALGTSILAWSADPRVNAPANQALLERLLRLNSPQAMSTVTFGAVPDTLRVMTYLLTDLNRREAVGVLGLQTQAAGDSILTASIDGFKPIRDGLPVGRDASTLTASTPHRREEQADKWPL